MPTAPPKRHRRHWTVRAATWLLLVLIIIVGTLYWTGERIARSILREKLQTLISQELNARLDIGDLDYHFPYGVSVSDVSLVTRGLDGKDTDLVSFQSLYLKVEKIPLGKGPLVIQRVDIEHPTVHIIRTAGGFMGENSLVRSSGDKLKDPTHPPKLSDVLKLRHIAFTGARIEYDDRTAPGNAPLVWENLDASIDSQPAGGASHRFAFSADNGNIARIESAGTLDLDSLVLNLEKMTISTRIQANQPNTTLPAQVQRLLAESGVAGAATITLHGTVPLLNVKDVDAGAQLRIDDGQCIVPGLPEPIEDMTLVASGEYRHGKAHGKIDRFDCRTASIGASLQPTEGTFDHDSGRWLAGPVKAAIVYQPVPSKTPFWRQKLTIDLRCGLHQMDDINQIEAVLDGTTLTPQGLAGDVRIDGSVAYSDGTVTVRPTAITGLGGNVGVIALANLRTRAYEAKITAQDVDLAKLNVVFDPTTDKEMNGQLKGEVRATMLGDLQNVTGEGGFRVTDGKFARMPVLSPIADFLHIGQGAFVANDAFGHFKIEKQTLGFDRMAVSTSLLRIRGQGSIGFDQTLDLKVYADSASNWQRDIERTGVPVFSKFVGVVFGGTQSIIGSVSKQFTTLSVTGTVAKPKIFPAPAPLLTDNLDRLFKAVE